MRTARMTAATAASTDDETRDLLDLVRAAKEGDERAFEELMIATERRVARLAWRILADADEVKDAVQETFIRLFRNLRRYDESRDFFGWLFRIAVNVCRDRARRQKLRRLFFLPLAHAAQPSFDARLDEAIARRDDAALLTAAIDTLPQKERLAIILREVEELPTDEVASILGNSAATVRVQVSNGRAKIRRWFEERGVTR